jgi:AraC-like DNA-binding protein
MDLSLINPYIRLAIKSSIPNGHTIAKRVIYDYELIYIEKGSFTFIYSDKKYSIKAGDFIFIRPGVQHSLIVDNGEVSQPHIHFDITYRPQSEMIPISFKDYSDMTSDEKNLIHKDYFYGYSNTPILNIKNKEEFLQTFYDIILGNFSDLIKKSLMLKLIAVIIEDNFAEIYTSEKKLSVISQIKDYIDAGNGVKMTLDDFSKTFFYDKFYLERKFKETYKVGLIEYRNNKKMELAKNLLKANSVSKVSEIIGYQSIYAFSRAFKNYFGYSPSKTK